MQYVIIVLKSIGFNESHSLDSQIRFELFSIWITDDFKWIDESRLMLFCSKCERSYPYNHGAKLKSN